MTTRGWVLLAAMGFIWGIPYLFIKIAVGELSPATVVFGRTAIGAALLLPIALLRSDFGPLRRHWRLLLVYTAVEIVGPWFMLSEAETRLSSSLSGLLIAGVPLATALLALATGHSDRPDALRWIGLAVGFIGVALVVGFNVATDDFIAVGEVGLVVSGYAIGVTLIARMREVPSLTVIAASLAISALVYLPFGLPEILAGPSARALGAVVVLGVVCTALGFLGFFALIREVGANRGTVVAYLNPAVAVALGVTILGEPFTPTIALGFVLIALGSYVGTRASRAVPEVAPVTAADRSLG